MSGIRLVVAILLAGCPASDPALAQEYPSKPLRIVVPVPPGGANDTLTRVIAPKLAEILKQPVVVENRGGANTTLGTAIVAKAPPDVTKLDDAVKAVLRSSDVADRLRALGYESFSMGPGELAAYLRSDLAKWGKVVRAAGIRAE